MSHGINIGAVLWTWCILAFNGQLAFDCKLTQNVNNAYVLIHYHSWRKIVNALNVTMQGISDLEMDDVLIYHFLLFFFRLLLSTEMSGSFVCLCCFFLHFTFKFNNDTTLFREKFHIFRIIEIITTSIMKSYNIFSSIESI